MKMLAALYVSRVRDVLTRACAHPASYATLLLFGYALLVAYRFEMTTGTVRNSDDTGNLLAGAEMAEGNWRLSGWVMATDNYYITDVLGQALLRAAFGFHLIFMVVWEALVWGAIACIGTWLACSNRPARERPGIALTALAMLAVNIFDHRFDDYFFFGVASHGCTILLTLSVFALVGAGASGLTRARLALMGVLVSIGCFCDPIFNVIACVPLLADAFLSIGKRNRSGAQAAVVFIGMLVARWLVEGMAWSGGFQSVRLSVSLASFGDLLAHATFAIESIVRLLGADFFGRSFGGKFAAGPVIQLARVPLVLLFAIAIGRMALDMWREVGHWPANEPGASPSKLDRLLCLSSLACITSTCITTVIYEQSGARFFLPVSVTGSVLAARLFGGRALIALYASVVFPASAAIGLAGLPSHQTPRSTMFLPQFRQIATVLREHGLQHGYAGYWEGTMITVLTNRKITSLPLIPDESGHLRAFCTLTNLNWYKSAAREWRGKVFFISASHPGGAELSGQAGRQQFGTPRERYDLGQFVIEVFDTSDPLYVAPAA